MSYDCVVDASVGIKLFLAEALSNRADYLFDQLAANPFFQLYVPDLFYVECANILWKHVRRFHYSIADAEQNLADLIALPLIILPTIDLVQEALTLAIQLGSTAYDAVYVMAAHRLALPLVTADEALARRMRSTSYDVRWLGEWP